MDPIKVFITEDESIVREGLRDMIPWEQYGFEFAGEASDGEMALPMVRRIKPDVLITDIKMPFMDGLAFSRLVSRELPKTRIIILSGYDDFEYARQAIELHVDQFLLKPISKAGMIEALELTKKHIEEEQEQQAYLRRFALESQAYEHYARRTFFEQLVGGALSVPEIYERSAQLEIELDAESYNIVLFSLRPGGDAASAEQVDMLQDALIQDLLRSPDDLVFRCSILSYAVLIKGAAAQVAAQTERCLEAIRSRCEPFGAAVEWYAAAGTPTARLSGLPQCYASANHALAFRHLLPQKHILSADLVSLGGEKLSSGDAVDAGAADPAPILGFIRKGLESEVEDFVCEYFGKLGAALESLIFRHYLLLSVRISALSEIEALGLDREELARRLPSPAQDASDDLRSYFVEVLRAAVSLRDEDAQRQSSQIVEKALEYIDRHYAEESISLPAVARSIGVSANYLSAMFSQTMGVPFVEYLTQKRMARAKQLLRQSDKRGSEIAAEVGYKDPRYFSVVFKKTQGCTPREYRAGEGAR